MNAGKFILVNGSFLPSEEYRITVQESDAVLFSEKIRSVRTAFPFFNETLELIKLKLLIYNQSFTDFTDRNGSGLKRQLERILTKNKHFMGAVFTITFAFNHELISCTIQSEKTESADYELNEKGLYLAVFDKIHKPACPLSNLSLGSEVYWDIARNHLRNSTADQLALINVAGLVVEVPESNIYLIKGKTIRGAGSENGAYMDITQPLMLDIFSQLKLVYTEKEGLRREDILEAEEMMSVNALNGVRWIVGFEEKRFFNNTIRKISDLFNQKLIN